MKAFISKCALSIGIKEVDDAELFSNGNAVSVKSLGTFANFHGEGKEWHCKREDAVKRGEAMRLEKIASLEKQITKLKALKFQ